MFTKRWSPGGALIAVLVCVIFLTGTARRSLAQASPPEELHTAEQIRNLSPEEADRHHPVKLRGVLTFFDQRIPSKAYRFIQDDTAGIYFYLYQTGEDPSLSSGQLVEVTGETGKGEFAPVVYAYKVTVLAPGTLPPAKPVTFESLASGQEDSQFVSIHGIVRSVQRDAQSNYFSLEIATGGGHLTAFAPHLRQEELNDLVDSTVEVHGVSITHFTRHRQLFDVGVLVPRAEDLTIEKPALHDPFAIPAQPIKSLLRFSREGTYGRRLKVAGTVTLRYADKMYIQDDTDGLFAHTTQAGDAQLGDHVEVLGFAAKGDYTPTLENATFRRVVAGPPIQPEHISADEALKGNHDCRLVQLEAKLLDRAEQGKEPFLVFQAGKNGTIFHAYMKWRAEEKQFADLQNGSTVAVTGVCLIDPGEDWNASEDWRAGSFRILLRSPDDITVLKRPPWWTLQKLLWAVGILCAVVFGAVIWVVVLDRRVHKQTGIIEEKLQTEAALKERYVQLFENANEMVFTLDVAGCITSINVAGERLLKRSRADVLTLKLTDFVAEGQRAAAKRWLEEVMQGEEPPTVEWDILVAGGQRLKLEITARVIEQAGKYREVEGMARDITERKRLEREILEISNKEQQRIGHDLHDGVCQQLAAIAYRTHIVTRRLRAIGAAESSEVEEIGGLINEALVQTRGVAQGLFPVRLEDNGLASALTELAANVSALFKISCSFTSSSPLPALDNGVALHVYYIAQEAIMNGARHGKANTISVRLTPEKDGWVLAVQDNGTGFNPASNSRNGMGIGIMNYRARVIGAVLDLKSRPGHGTQVSCEFDAAFRQLESISK